MQTEPGPGFLEPAARFLEPRRVLLQELGSLVEAKVDVRDLLLERPVERGFERKLLVDVDPDPLKQAFHARTSSIVGR